MTWTPARPDDYVKLARSCWVPRASKDDLPAVCAAVLAGSHVHSALGFVTAAKLHGLWLPDLPQTVHVASVTPGSLGRAMTRSRRPQFTAHRLQVSEADIVMIDGLAVTSLARTWRDLATVLPLPDLVAAGDSALRLGASLTELTTMVSRSGRVRGVRALRQALPLLDARARSRPESHMRVAVQLTGLTGFIVNEPIYRDEGGWLAEPDMAFPEAKLALEYQGEAHAEVKRMRRDITRRRDVRQNDWLMLDYGPAEVLARPWSVGAEVMGYLRQRAPHLLPSR